MRTNQGFGILLIQAGTEVRKKSADAPVRFASLGTAAKIVDFDQIEGNLLGILVEGVRRFRLGSSWEEEDHLLVGDIEYLEEEGYEKPTDVFKKRISKNIKDISNNLELKQFLSNRYT